MRRFVLILTAMIFAGLTGCGQKTEPPPPPPVALPKPLPEVIARFRFLGWDKISVLTNAAKLKTIAALPDSVTLRQKTVDKLAQAWPGYLSSTNDTASKASDALIRPLLEDAGGAESYIEIRGATNQPPAWIAAFQLNEERAQLWQTNLWQMLAGASANAPRPFSRDRMSGWSVELSGGRGKYELVRVGGWTLFGSAGDDRVWQTLIERVKSQGQPDPLAANTWMELEVDSAQWPALQKPLALAHWPKIKLSISPTGEYLRSFAQVSYPAPVAWPVEPWRIPTNTIHDPILSFTAIQGVSPWLQRQPFTETLQLASVPNELFAWARIGVPFETLVSFPFPQATNQIEGFTRNLQNRWNPMLKTNALGEIKWQTNRLEAAWQGGMPFLIPFLRPAAEPGNDFVVGGIFPTSPGDQPVPPELIAQFVGRTNLLYYDWEITEGRLAQWRQIWKLIQVSYFPGYYAGAAKTPADSWLEKVGSYLGNSITEATVVSPKELNIVRKSHLGLTGMELVALAQWLDNTNFPALHYFMTAREAKVVKPPPTP